MGAVTFSLMLAACGDDGGGGSANETGAARASTGEAPTTSEEAGSTGVDGTTGAAALTPEELVGRYVSAGCEDYPDGKGGHTYLTRDFTLTTSTWHLELAIFMDAGCATPLFTSVIDGPYTLGAGSATVAGATEGEFAITSNVWTARQGFMADTFTMQGCGAAPWVVDEPQDVAGTGCIGVAHPIAECPREYDVVALLGDDLYFGERITDLCSEAGRPAALGAYPVVRS